MAAVMIVVAAVARTVDLAFWFSIRDATPEVSDDLSV